MSKFNTEYSNFPTQKITKHNFIDVNDDISSLVNQINILRSQGQYSQAAQLLQANKEVLSRFIVDAETFRTWEDEIYNAQKYAKQVQQSIYFEENEEDVDCLEGDVWIGL
jgi:hypothetical protein